MRNGLTLNFWGMRFRLWSYIILVVQVTVLAGLTVQGQSNYTFHRFGVRDGLGHQDVFSLMQDRYGYIWIGTGNALHRFDGQDLLTYSSERNSTLSIGDGFVRSLFMDDEDRLWIGTEEGLTSLHQGQLTTYKISLQNGYLNHKRIEHAIGMPDGSIFFATWGGGINQYKNGRFLQIGNGKSGKRIIHPNVVDVLYDYKNDALWVATWDGGICVATKQDTVCFKEGQKGFDATRARTLAQTSDGTMWIGSWGEGLYRFSNGKFERHWLDEDGKDDVGQGKILALEADNNGGLWVGTFGSGVIYIDGAGRHSYFLNDPNNLNSISSNYVECMMLDREGSLWVGTKGGGITKVERTFFTTYNYSSWGKSTSDAILTRGVVINSSGRYLIAAGQEGCREIGSTEHRIINGIANEYFSQATIFTLYGQSSGEIWIGGEIGNGTFTIKDEQVFRSDTNTGINFASRNINRIRESSDGKLWFSLTYSGGLAMLDDQGATFFQDQPDNPTDIGSNEIVMTYEASDGAIWIGTWREGLIKYENGDFTSFKHDKDQAGSLSNNLVLAVTETPDGTIWVGTAEGFNRLSGEGSSFEVYYQEDGLMSNFITALTVDRNGEIWLGNVRGLSKFDPKDEVFSNYPDRQGIANNPFNYFLQEDKGQYIYYVADKGFLRFNIDSVEFKDKKPKILLTAVEVNNMPHNEYAAEQDFIPVEKLQEIEIESQGLKSLNIAFASLNMDFSLRSEFAYRMEGIDDHWNYIGEQNFVYFANLEPGDYAFLIKSTLDGINWSETRGLGITVLPAWWETVWFRLFSIIMVVFMAWLYSRWRSLLQVQKRISLQKLVRQRTQEIRSKNQMLEKQSKELAEQNKNMERFAYLASHDLQAPLHTITGFVGLLETFLPKEHDAKLDEIMSAINKSTERMTDLIKGLLQYSKVGKDVEFEEVDCQVLLEEILEDLSRMIEEAGAEIKVEEMPVVNGFKSELRTLFQNLLTNAIKFRRPNTTPKITVKCCEDPEGNRGFYQFAVSDNGIGIRQEHVGKVFGIFERFETEERYKGTGIGLAHCQKVVDLHKGKIWVESVHRRGSTFYFTIAK